MQYRDGGCSEHACDHVTQGVEGMHLDGIVNQKVTREFHRFPDQAEGRAGNQRESEEGLGGCILELPTPGQ